MLSQQTVTVNIHRPKIEEVEVQESGVIAVGLGNGVYHGAVSVFFEDLDALKAFIVALEDKVDEIEETEAADRYAAVLEDRPSAAELLEAVVGA